MAFWAGLSGLVTVTASAHNWPVGRWKLQKKRVMGMITNSTSGGIKQRKATVKDQMVTFELPWDDAINPEASGFSEGSDVSMILNLGLSGKEFTSSSVIIETCEYDNDEDEDVIRLMVTGYANVAFVYT